MPACLFVCLLACLLPCLLACLLACFLFLGLFCVCCFEFVRVLCFLIVVLTYFCVVVVLLLSAVFAFCLRMFCLEGNKPMVHMLLAYGAKGTAHVFQKPFAKAEVCVFFFGGYSMSCMNMFNHPARAASQWVLGSACYCRTSCTHQMCWSWSLVFANLSELSKPASAAALCRCSSGGKISVVQWHPFFLFLVAAPLKIGFPKKSSLLFQGH